MLVLINGSMIAVNGAKQHIPAIVEAWYPGEEGGNAIADVLFGRYNPAERLPVTFYKQTADLPPLRITGCKAGHTAIFTVNRCSRSAMDCSYTTFAYHNLGWTRLL